MLTIEKFYFSHDEVEQSLSGGADGTDWHINFLSVDGESVNIKIVMRGQEDFRKLIQSIYDIGMGMLEPGQVMESAAAGTKDGVM